MDKLNAKVKASRDDAYTSAQIVGMTGYNSTQDRMKVAHVSDSNEVLVTSTGAGPGVGHEVKVMGSETGAVSGAQHQCRVDGNGRLSVDINSGVPTKTDGTSGHSPATGVGIIAFEGGTARAVAANSSGHVKVNVENTANVKFEDISSSLNSGTANDPANSLAVGLRARTDIADAATETFLKCDAAGVLQTSGSGGGGGGGTTFTIETKSVPDNTLTIIGDGSNAYIDTNGGSKFTISVLSATFTGSPAINIEWSDNSSFSAGKVFICNGYIGGAAITTPQSLQSITRLDGTTLAIQGIVAYENIPARYARITIEQTSGGAITYVANSVLSP